MCKYDVNGPSQIYPKKHWVDARGSLDLVNAHKAERCESSHQLGAHIFWGVGWTSRRTRRPPANPSPCLNVEGSLSHVAYFEIPPACHQRDRRPVDRSDRGARRGAAILRHPQRPARNAGDRRRRGRGCRRPRHRHLCRQWPRHRRQCRRHSRRRHQPRQHRQPAERRHRHRAAGVERHQQRHDRRRLQRHRHLLLLQRGRK